MPGPELQECPKCHGAATSPDGCAYCGGEGVTFVMDAMTSQVLLGDCRKLGSQLPPSSVDIIFTDPPYLDEFNWAWSYLGELADRVLKPSGHLISFVGKHNLDVAMRGIQSSSDQLRYWWMIAAWQPDSNTRFWSKRIMGTWRPLLWYRKPPLAVSKSTPWVPDGRRSVRDKSFHEWGQGAELVMFYLHRIAKPGSLVLDPFTGGGTIPAVCKMLGLPYLGFEVDDVAWRTSQDRLDTIPEPLFILEPEVEQFELPWEIGADGAAHEDQAQG